MVHKNYSQKKKANPENINQENLQIRIIRNSRTLVLNPFVNLKVLSLARLLTTFIGYFALIKFLNVRKNFSTR